MMVFGASVILLLTPAVCDEHVGQRGLSPQRGGNHWVEPNAALPVRLPGVRRSRNGSGTQSTEFLGFGGDSLLKDSPALRQELVTPTPKVGGVCRPAGGLSHPLSQPRLGPQPAETRLDGARRWRPWPIGPSTDRGVDSS